LNVGTGSDIGESIIQDVNGLSVTIHRSLRDLLGQFPSVEVIVKVIYFIFLCNISWKLDCLS